MSKLYFFMNIQVEKRLSPKEVLDLLANFDDSSDKLLHEQVNLKEYSEKLSSYAFFILAYEDSVLKGFIAYYLNDKNKFVYITQIVVHQSARHKGLGHTMMTALVENTNDFYECIRLEVLTQNSNAKKFYIREGFYKIEDRDSRILLQKDL